MQNEPIYLERMAGGHKITVRALLLDEGATVLLTGGVCTHIGAVSLAEPGAPLQTLTRPGHREAVVTEPFAAGLCARLGVPAVVTGGIHYEHAGKALIKEIVDACGVLEKETAAALCRQREQELLNERTD